MLTYQKSDTIKTRLGYETKVSVYDGKVLVETRTIIRATEVSERKMTLYIENELLPKVQYRLDNPVQIEQPLPPKEDVEAYLKAEGILAESETIETLKATLETTKEAV